MPDAAALPVPGGPWLAAWWLVALVPSTALLVVLSALVERSSPIRLRHWAEEAGGRLLGLYDDPPAFEAFRFLLSILARAAPVVLGWALWRLFSGLALGWPAAWAIAAAGLFLILVEWGNRALVEIHSEEALRALTAGFRGVHRLLVPAVWLLRGHVPHAEDDDPEEEYDPEDDDEVSEEEIKAFIDVGRREGILEPEDEDLLRSIVDFGDTEVRSVMTPRVEVISAPETASLEELAQVFFDSKHARLPLFRQSIDHVVGILHIRDLFAAMHDGTETDGTALAKAPYFVPENKRLSDLLRELQAARQQMAIVLDEYGGVAGLVTVEDLLEEIVGEISDEHETDDDERVRLGDGEWRLSGREHLEELGDLFELRFDFDELPYETVSGLICGELGYVPKPGTVFAKEGLVMTVEEADERRVTSVVVRAEAPPPAAGEAGAS